MARTYRNSHLRWLSDEGDPARFRTRTARRAPKHLSDAARIAEGLELLEEETPEEASWYAELMEAE